MILDVYALPACLPEVPDYDWGVAIDVLRATSVIATSLAAGARCVIPFKSVEETLDAKLAFLSEHPQEESQILLGGERKGVRIDGFDLANSPADYTPEVVANKTIFFSTTNGTKAILSGAARQMITASFLNAETVIQFLGSLSADAKVAFICAGTDNETTTEDLLLAGYLVNQVARVRSETPVSCNIQAETSRQMWSEALRSFFDNHPRSRHEIHTKAFRGHLASVLRNSRGGANLVRIGLSRDIVAAARIDSANILPVLRGNALVAE